MQSSVWIGFILRKRSLNKSTFKVFLSAKRGNLLLLCNRKLLPHLSIFNLFLLKSSGRGATGPSHILSSCSGCLWYSSTNSSSTWEYGICLVSSVVWYMLHVTQGHICNPLKQQCHDFPHLMKMSDVHPHFLRCSLGHQGQTQRDQEERRKGLLEQGQGSNGPYGVNI